MKLGFYISGFGHAALILWILFGGLFERAPKEPEMTVAEVSVISSEEFAALSSPKEGAPEPEPVPEPEPAPETAAPQVTPTPPARPEPEPEPQPEPEPEPEPQPEPTPEPQPTETPDPEAAETIPDQADRVANEAAPEPEVTPEVTPEPAPDTAPAEEAVVEPVDTPEPSAPEAATTEIVTEADEPQTAAPTTSIRPARRPDRPEPQPEPSDTQTAAQDRAPEQAAQTPPEPAADPVNDALNDAITDAVSDVLNDLGAGGTDAPTGPPLSSAERDGLRIAVSNCWNLGTSSTDAADTTVVVLVDMSREAKPTNIKLVSSNGPTQDATRIAFDAARRAIILCGADGFPLPAEKYEQWREIEMTFNPRQMGR